jgi:hypothetical protein
VNLWRRDRGGARRGNNRSARGGHLVLRMNENRFGA